MRRFEILDITGDAGIRAFGLDLPELFVHAAAGMYSLITDPVKILEAEKITVSAEGSSLEGLFVSWLNELIFQFDTYGFIAKHLLITGVFLDREPLKVTAALSGETFDPGRHEGKLLIKAATYHRLRIEKTGDIWEAEVIFDI